MTTQKPLSYKTDDASWGWCRDEWKTTILNQTCARMSARYTGVPFDDLYHEACMHIAVRPELQDKRGGAWRNTCFNVARKIAKRIHDKTVRETPTKDSTLQALIEGDKSW